MADAAGEVIRKYFRKSFEILDKDDLSPVTIADRDAEESMVSVILENFPSHAIYGEENGWRCREKSADYVWVLDPIDGTKSFITGKPLFGTLIALLHNGKLVHKQGIALGRSVDLTKFNGYDELFVELDQMFEFDGELMAPNKSWLIVYTDNEGDMMLVGDDPWHMVRKIFIYTHEEVQRMNPGALINPRVEGRQGALEEKSTVKDIKSPLQSPAANGDNC